MSRLPEVSPIYPAHVGGAGDCVPFAQLVAQRGRGRFWLGQSAHIENHSAFAALAGMGIHVPCASGVALTPMRHPFHLAVEARSVALLSGHPYVCCIGPGPARFQETMHGDAYRRPVAATEDYARAVRELLDGARVSIKSEGFTADSLELPSLSGTADAAIGLGVLRPAMARAAGRVADYAITWLTPAGYVRDVLVPAAGAAAAAAGRAAPRFACVVQAALARAGRDPVRLAYASADAHLSMPHYTAMLTSAGVPCDPAEPEKGARALVEHHVYAYGSPSEIAEHLAEYRAAGVTEVVLSVAGVMRSYGRGQALLDLREILAACDEEGRQ